MKVLAIAPHPDDEVLGCGGTLAKLADDGHDVAALVVVERERGGHDASFTDEDFAAEAAKACGILGISSYEQLDEPSRDLRASRSVRARIVEALRRVRPDVLFIPHSQEGDREHALVHELCRDALWMAESSFFTDLAPPVARPSLVLGYEVWTPMTEYQYVTEIDTTIDRKVEAIRAYDSQIRRTSWDVAIRGLAAYRGTAVAGTYAEVFTVVSLGSGKAAGRILEAIG